MKKLLISLFLFMTVGYSQFVTPANLPYYISELYFIKTHVDSLLPADSSIIYIEGYLTAANIDTGNIGYLNQAETIAGNWINTTNPWAENELVSTVLVESDLNTFGELQALVADKTLVNEEDIFQIDANWSFTDSVFIDTLQFSRIYGLDSLNIDSLNFVPDLEFADYKTALDTGNIGYLNQAETIAGNWINTDNPWAENELVSTVLVESDLNTFSELQSLVADKTLINEEDDFTITGLYVFSDSTYIDTLEFSRIFGLDSLNVDSLNFVPDLEMTNLKATTMTAGDGLRGGGDLSASRTFTVNLDFDGGLETTDDSINVKLDGASLAKGVNGLKINSLSGFETDPVWVSDSTDYAVLAHNEAITGEYTFSDTLNLTDGTDVFSIASIADKFTIYNDANTQVAIVTIDSTGNVISIAEIQGEHLKSTDDIEVADDILMADGGIIGITGNEIMTFNAAGSINITGATMDVDGAFSAASVASDAGVSGIDADFSGDLYLDATKKVVLADDGDDHTYIVESGADIFDLYVGGVNTIKATESTTISGVLYNVWDVTGAFTANSMVSDNDVTAATVASITAGNLVDKSAVEAIAGEWTFSDTLNLSDGTDEFSLSVDTDKWTIWNDANTQAAIFQVDSIGNLTLNGTVDGKDIATLLGATPGTATASVALIVDASKDITLDGGDLTAVLGNFTGNVESNSNNVIEGYGSGRLVLRKSYIRIFPGATPNTNLDIDVNAAAFDFNQPTITDADDLAKSGSSGSFSLNASGNTITMDISETIISMLAIDFIIQDLNTSSTIAYWVDGQISGGNLTFAVRITGSSSALDWTAITDAADDGLYMTVLYLTST